MCQAFDGTVSKWSGCQMEEHIAASRLAKIIASLKEALLQQSFEAGKLLIELEQEKNYGEWGTFENFVESELRIRPRTAYRLMFAYRMRELFKKHGRVLPVSEGSVRPLSELRLDKQRAKIKLTLEELQLKAWNIAVAMKQRSTPTEVEVRRAVRRLMAPKPDESTDKAFRAYRSHFHRIKTELATATKRMADLAAFLECDDKKSKRQKKDTSKMLAKLTMSLEKHYFTFAETWAPDKKLFEKGDYLAALSKAARLERMVVILRVRDWCRRTGFQESVGKLPVSPVHPVPDIAYTQSLEMWTRTVGVTGQ
jgi:hypothetical protein